MKKYIIASTLLAAGTLFANAEAQKLTLTSPSGATLAAGNQPVGWSESYSELQSWELSFTLTDNVLPQTGGSNLFGTRQNGGVAGFALRVTSNGGLEVYTYKTGVDAANNQSILTLTDSVVASQLTAITLKFVADVDASNQVVGGTFTLSSGDKSQSATIGDRFSSSVLAQTSLKNNSGSRFYTNNGQETFTGITVTKLDNKVIPEPSAFGLLAGVGALALVASRRRRK